MFEIACPDVLFTERCQLRCNYCFEKKANKDIDAEDFKKYIEDSCFTGFFPFGGEPLLRIDLLVKVLDSVDKRKKDIITENLITNGILVPKYIDLIKKYNIKLQISLDGPKHVHDKHRVYSDGRGSYDDVMKAIDSCIENDVTWSIHGVCARDNIQHFSESVELLFNLNKKKGLKHALDKLSKNMIQIIFEENYTDKDIDTIIKQFYDIPRWILNDKDLAKEGKRLALKNFFTRTGGVCGAGNSLIAIDSDFNIYPCHRLATVPEREDYKLGNIYKPKEFKNHKLYNSFVRTRKVGNYSAKTNLVMNYKNPWFMWCPATNMQTSKSIYYQNAKYNIVFSELERAIEDIKKRYKITDGNTKQRNNC